MAKLTKSECYKAVKADYTLMYKPMPKEWKELFPVISIDVAEKFGLHLTDKHTGKMTGFTSLSTTCKCNELCIRRIAKSFENIGIKVTDTKSAREALKQYLAENPLAEDVLICAFCFSDIQQDYQKSMTIPLDRNFQILNNGIIHSDWLPVVNVLYFRGGKFRRLYI